jgi:hypothetical protein
LWNAGLEDRQFLRARIALCEEALMYSGDFRTCCTPSLLERDRRRVPHPLGSLFLLLLDSKPGQPAADTRLVRY